VAVSDASLPARDDAWSRVGDADRVESKQTSIPHVTALDGARGIAVVGVLLFHGGHLLGGYLGVDLFFTLSGFLITSLLLAEASRTGRVGLGAFWARRARRLLPALMVVMVGVAVYAWVGAAPEQLGQIRGDALATLGYVANWHEIFAHQSYFALFAGPSPLQHTWSLAIEEQFYVIWPLLFVGLVAGWKRASSMAVLVASLVLAGASSALMIVVYQPGDSSRAYFGTDTRAAAILFGAALAAWLNIHGPTTSRQRRIALEMIGLAGVVVLAIAWTRLDGQSSTLYRGGFLLCGLAATAVLAAAVHPEPGPISQALSLRPLCALGLISYGVYLYHWPLDVFLDPQRVGFGGWPLLAFRTAVTVGVAVVSYRIIEQPVRRGALSSGQLRRLAPALAVSVVVVVFASTNGASSSLASVVVDPAINAAVGSPINASVGTGTRVQPAAGTGRVAPPSLERVMVVGNSVAYLLGKSFEDLDTKPHLAVFDAGVLGCTFPPEVNVPNLTLPDGATWKATPCDPPWETDVVHQFRPQVVFWIVSNPTGAGGTYLGQHVEPCSRLWDSLYQQSLRREVQILGATGAKVVITTAAYSRLFGLHFNDHATDCDNQLRRQVATETGTQLIDLYAYTCPQGQCPAEQNGITLRPDGLHYAGPGGEIVARWMLGHVR
jgi:peptidoglycan/LPS O-acetylase OafA/YrhL